MSNSPHCSMVHFGKPHSVPSSVPCCPPPCRAPFRPPPRPSLLSVLRAKLPCTQNDAGLGPSAVPCQPGTEHGCVQPLRGAVPRAVKNGERLGSVPAIYGLIFECVYFTTYLNVAVVQPARVCQITDGNLHVGVRSGRRHGQVVTQDAVDGETCGRRGLLS